MTIGILVLLVFAGAIVTLFAFQEKLPDGEPAEKDRTVKQIKLKGDFEKKWAVNASGELITSLASENSTVFYSANGITALDAETGNTLWESKALAGSAPITVDEGIILGIDPDGRILAFESATGQEKWRVATDKQSTQTAMTGKNVFYTNKTGVAVALDKDSGQEMWRSTISADNVRATVSTVAEGETMYVLSGDTRIISSSLTAIGATDGAVKWVHTVDDPMASMCAGSGMVFLLSQTSGTHEQALFNLAAYDSNTGSVKWQSNIESDVPPVMNYIDGRLYFGSISSNGATLHGLDPATGIEQWSCRPESRTSVPTAFAVKDGLVYLNDFSEIYAADAESGKIWWNVKAGGGLVVQPEVAGDSICFAYASGGTLYALPLFHL